MPIIAEQPGHAAAIEQLLDHAFGTNRGSKTVYRLREGVPPIPELCLVVTPDGGRDRDGAGEAVLEGTIRFWPVKIAGAVPALLLGPVAVAEQRRSEGLGAVLIQHSLERAAALGHRIVLLVGDAPYYGRFGFTRKLTLNLVLPGPVDLERFLGLELDPGALAGVVGPVGRAV